MESEVKKYKKYKKSITLLLGCSGVWPDMNKHQPLFRIFLSFMTVFVSGVACYGVISFCIDNITSIIILTRGLGLLFSFTSAVLKVMILRLYGKEMLRLNRGVSARFEKDLEDPELRPYLLAPFSGFSKCFYFFTYSAGINTSLMIIMPLLGVRHGKYGRIFPQRIPFSFEPGSLLYWCIYGFETLTTYYNWSVAVGTDGSFGLYTLHMVGELRVVAAYFEKLKSSKDYKKDLKECVDRHFVVYEAKRLVQKVYGFLTIWLAVTCAIIMCTIIFQASEITNLSAYKAFYLGCYAFIKLVQAYSYAWYGNVLNVESELCLNSIYNAHWPGSGDVEFMKDVLIIQSQNPMMFTAGGFMTVQQDMFSKILNTSVSYFFLLQTLDEKI